MNIKKIKAIRIIDSRGVPTIRTFVFTDNAVGVASVPSGTSSGKREALELRDGGKAFGGKDVTKAINNVNSKISKKLIGEFILDQKRIDELMLELDNTENKSNLGANAILSVSLACAKAASLELDVPLHNYISKLNYKKGKNKMPIPFLNIINGGAHAGTELAFQEFQIVPHKKTFSENIRVSCEIYHTLKDIISRKYGAGSTNVGLEGGFAPNINDPKDALDLMEDAIIKAGNKKEITIGLDVAASEIYNNKKYLVNSKKYSSEEMMDYYSSLLKSYNITSIEDPLSEDDKLSWPIFTKKFGNKIAVIGDDLLVTNPKLIKEAIKKKQCNSLLLKVNQIGTLTESVEAFNLAKKANWKVVVSHRSGETEDSFIADLSYGLGSDFIKFGSPVRSERTAKYNRLLEIEGNIM
ncbi:MAG TPA: phosphopyruvate hydratase [archaeon]|jgi:enolase|nr:phosphopyruvate hydratase [archaeon]HPV66203.1 phosphopyruvate hydratase [archaeon]